MMGDLVRLLIVAVLVSTCVVAQTDEPDTSGFVLDEGEVPPLSLDSNPTPPTNAVYMARYLHQKEIQFLGKRDDLQKKHIHGPTVDDANIKIILDLHNEFRGQVKPTAKHMAKIFWSPELAESAQALANECREVKHDDPWERRTKSKLGVNIGQNYALGNNASDWSGCVHAWYNEIKDFTYGVHVSAKTGHYTQQVRGPTTHIGCGSAHCPNLETTKEPKRSWYCNYVQMNMDYIHPYKLGETCEACKDTCTDNGLCDCGADWLCQYGSIPDYNTCTCECQFGFTGENCTECPLVDMSPHCLNWTPDQCGEFTNIPDECPVMCGECPKKCSNDDLRCKNGGVLTEVGDGTCECVCAAGYSGETCECNTSWLADDDEPGCGWVDLDEWCTYTNIKNYSCKFACNC